MTHFCENVIIGLLCSPEHSTSPYRFWIGLISFPVVVISLRKVAPLLKGSKTTLESFHLGGVPVPCKKTKISEKNQIFRENALKNGEIGVFADI